MTFYWHDKFLYNYAMLKNGASKLTKRIQIKKTNNSNGESG